MVRRMSVFSLDRTRCRRANAFGLWPSLKAARFHPWSTPWQWNGTVPIAHSAHNFLNLYSLLMHRPSSNASAMHRLQRSLLRGGNRHQAVIREEDSDV